MLTYQLGAASYAGASAFARYISEETLSVAQTEERARYYAAEAAPRNQAEVLAAAVHRGEIGFTEALDTLMQAELAAMPSRLEVDYDEIEARLSQQIADGVTRADFAEEVRDQTPGVVRPDMSPAMARRLGIDTARPLSIGGAASLMAGLNVMGGEIEGKHRQSPMVAVGTVYGLSATTLPSPAELGHVLGGRRIDGSNPVTADNKPMPAHVIKGAQRRFRAAVGLSSDREPTATEWANVAAGKMASGGFVDMDNYRRAITGTRPPIGFADLTFSASKSLSSAWAVAATEQQRAALMGVHDRAVSDTMHFMADQLGWARKGHAGRDGVERAELTWISYRHYTSRPTLHLSRSDAAGNEYTDFREVASLRADPNVHTHVILLPHALVPGTGRIASVDFDRLNGLVHQGGEVYRAYAAKHARAIGIRINIGEKGDAQMTDVDLKLQRLHSKRSQEAEQAAKLVAADKGLDWHTLTSDQKIGLMKTAAAQTRKDKVKDAVADHDYWRKEAAAAGIDQAPVIHRQRIEPELTPERRFEVAREILQPMIEKEFAKTAVMDGDDIRALAARAMIVSGIGNKAFDEISAVTRLLRKSGLRQDGQQTDFIWDKTTLRGKQRTVVSTDRHLATEQDVIALTERLAADRSLKLSPAAFDQAAAVYLQRHPEIDPNGPWKQQVEWAHQLSKGPRLALGFGAAGVGKSTVMQILTDAWKAEGRTVFGAVLSHTQVADLAGIDDKNKTAMDPFLRRAAKGQYKLDQNSVIVIDEAGLLGNKQMRELLKLGERTGAAIVMIGDPAQCRSPEAGDPLALIELAMPDVIPELVKSIRQRSAHERDVTEAFRTDAAAGLTMKIEDGSARLVAGGTDATIERAVALRRERMQAAARDPDYSLAVMAPTNATASAVSRAIRADRQRHAEIGPDKIELNAVDRTGRHKLKLGIGDDVRVYSLIWEKRRIVARNGEALRIQNLDGQGMDVRNLKTGVEGRITWAQLSKEKGDPARISYAGCSTVDSAQGSTVSEALFVLADGTDGARANKVYTALSRHRDGSYMLVSDAAIRRQIAKRSVIGEVLNIRQPEVWNKVGANISRAQTRENATTAIRQVHRNAGLVSGASEAMESEVGQALRLRDFTIRRVMDYARDVQHRVAQAIGITPSVTQAARDRGRAASPSVERDGPRQDEHQISRGPSLSR